MKNFKHLHLILLSITSLSSYAQTSKKTLNYQAVILDPNAIDIPGASISGQPLSKGNVCLRFSLLNTAGGVDYEETQQATTDEFGLVSLTIGTGTPSSSASIYKNFESIVWNANVKSLKVSVSYDGCSSFKQVSTQALNYTPYALYAEAVDYKNVREAPTKLSQFSNDAGYLIPKDLDPIKADIKSNTTQIQTASQSIADNKLANDAAFLIVNQSLTSLDKEVADNTSSITTMNSRINDQQNQIFDNRNQLGGLQGQLNVTNSTVSNLTGAAEVVSNKSASTTLGGVNASDQLYPTQRATKTYVDQAVAQISSGTISDATTLAAGKIQLAGDLGGTATRPTVPGLANKADINSPTFTGSPTAPTPSLADNSTQIATTAYVQNKVNAATVNDATSSAKGILQLAGDLAGTAASPLVTKIQGKSVSNTTPTSGQVLTYDGTSWAPASGALSGTVAIGNGGTGATTKTPAFDALSPMTTAGDIIYGGASGSGTRLAKGTDGQVLQLSNGFPSWQAGFYKETERVAFGANTGRINQGIFTTAVGPYSGESNQADNATALGRNAGNSFQGGGAVAIGLAAGEYGQGANSIAIGTRAAVSNQHVNSIMINATGNDLNTSSASALYIAPIRSATNSNVLLYNTMTKEVTTESIGSIMASINANLNDQTGTTYTLQASDNGKVITLNNVSAITLTVPSGLTAGFNCMIVQKGAGVVTLAASGVTIANRIGFTRTGGTNAIVTLVSIATNYFITGGDMQ